MKGGLFVFYKIEKMREIMGIPQKRL